MQDKIQRLKNEASELASTATEMSEVKCYAVARVFGLGIIYRGPCFL